MVSQCDHLVINANLDWHLVELAKDGCSMCCLSSTVLLAVLSYYSTSSIILSPQKFVQKTIKEINK